jgi:rhodanese-related sulfurtransferase
MRTLRILASVFAFACTSACGDAPKSVPANVTNVTVEEAEKLLKEKPGVVVLDVRTEDEFKAGHIAGAKNVDFLDDNFAKEVAKLDPATPILVHCAGGGRSGQSLPILKDLKTVYHLKDGFKAWEKAGKPVEGAAKK